MGWPNIAFVGRLTHIKNPSLFVSIAEYIDFPMHIIGEGELKNQLKEQTYITNKYKNIYFYGWQKDMVDVYMKMDMVVCTSLNEGTPVALIEAAVAGLPIVAPDLPSIKEVFRNSKAILYSDMDAISFASAINFIMLYYKEFKTKAKIFSKEIYEKYKKENLIREIERIYQIEKI